VNNPTDIHGSDQTDAPTSPEPGGPELTGPGSASAEADTTGPDPARTVPAGLAVAVSGSPAIADPPTSLTEVITRITAWLVGIAAGLATLFLTYGAVRYLSAGGDPGSVEKAKTALRSAALGYGLALLAPLVVTVLNTFVS
jgi:hypothetical protein